MRLVMMGRNALIPGSATQAFNSLALQNTVHVTLWLQGWHTHTLPQYLATLAFLFLLAVAQEYVAAYRSRLGTAGVSTRNGDAGENEQYLPLIGDRWGLGSITKRSNALVLAAWIPD